VKRRAKVFCFLLFFSSWAHCSLLFECEDWNPSDVWDCILHLPIFMDPLIYLHFYPDHVKNPLCSFVTRACASSNRFLALLVFAFFARDFFEKTNDY